MLFQSLEPKLTERFKQQMVAQDWMISHQDAGQTHLVGWGYMITWKKQASQVTLRYENRQDEESVLLEMTPCANAELQVMIEHLHDKV